MSSRSSASPRSSRSWRLVDGEGLRAPLGEGRVPFVEVVGHVAEEERRREGRGRLRVHGDEPDLAAADAGGDLHEPRQIEHVAQALAVGLEHDREGRVARGHLQQVVGALPLHPQRRPVARPAPREEKRPGRRLAEARGEEARAPELADHEVLDLLGLGQEVRRLRGALALGQAEDDPVVAPDRLHLGLARLPQARLEGDRPRRVDAPAPRREQAEAPVPHLVARALEHDRAVVGQDAGRLALVLEVGEEVLRGQRIEVVVALQPLGGFVPGGRQQLAGQAADRAAHLHRPPAAVGLPERHLPRLAGGGDDEHAVARDLGDAPAGGAEDEDLAGAALEDHLLVELADALRPAPAVGEEDAVEPAVGNGARVLRRRAAACPRGA